jgi:hypothetical protein
MSERIKNAQDQYVETVNDSIFNDIENYIAELSYNASQNSETVANLIESNIRDKYSDLSVLENEMKEEDYTNLNKLISSTLTDKVLYLNGVKNSQNSIIVATSKDIIYNKDYSSTVDDDSATASHETTADFIEKNYNRELAENAYKEIITMPDSYLFIEPYESNVKGHKYYKKVTIDTLREVYSKEGIEGLKNYELVVPAYINDTGDIFGHLEITQGVKHDTYRLIVVQRCNIYDQIVQHKSYLVTESTDQVSKNRNLLLNLVYIVGIVIFVNFIVYLIPMIILFNTFIIGSNEDPIVQLNKK